MPGLTGGHAVGTAPGSPIRRLARCLPGVPAAERGARQDLLPRHPAAAAGQTTVRACALRVRPVRRRDRRRPGPGRGAGPTAPPGGAADGLHHRLADRTQSGARRAAVLDTAQRWQIPWDTFDAFLESMAMDLTVTRYETYADLQRYMYGSAAVIGLQMLPILEPSDTAAAAAGAMKLGEAFQLANFIRDVGEDLDRGRIYLPLAELAEFGVTARAPAAAHRRRRCARRAGLPGRPCPPVVRRGGPDGRAAAPGDARLHRDRPGVVLRDRRSGRSHRLPGVLDCVPGCRRGAARSSRGAPGTGRARARRRYGAGRITTAATAAGHSGAGPADPDRPRTATEPQ